MRFQRRKLRFLLISLFLSAIALANSGCLALILGGAAAGGAAGYAYYRGNVTHDFPAAFGPTWSATHQALQDLQLPVVTQNTGVSDGEIESVTSDGHRIYIYVEPSAYTTGPMTRVHVRIGTFGDHELSNYIHERIAINLPRGEVNLGAPSIINDPNVIPSGHVAPPTTNEPPIGRARPTALPPPAAGNRSTANQLRSGAEPPRAIAPNAQWQAGSR